MLEFLSRKKWIIVFICIFFAGILLRTVSFGDLLVLKSDQARDALIMSQVKDGSFLDIPLLGPQVGGTELRLGPITYYFQYISAEIFGFTAESFAYPDLVFGILTIPLLYLLFRKFFSLPLSLWMTALASVSLLLVTFSRFGWNPNSLSFFTALFAIAFLTALESKGKKRWRHLALAAACVGVVAQLHLAAIIGLLLGLFIFWILLRSLLNWKEVLFFAMIVAIFHLPVFVSEWQTRGGNMQELVRAFNKKGAKDSQHFVSEKIFRAYQENSRIAWLIATGQQNTDLIQTKGHIIKCDNKCESALPYSIAGMLVFGYMVAAGYLSWKNENDKNRKRAIAFIGLWMGGFSIVTVLLAYQLETRFYLGIVPPLLVLLGLAIERVMISRHIWMRPIMISLGIAILAINFYATLIYLKELSSSQTSAKESGRDLRFGTAPKVTLGQLRRIGGEASARFNNDAPVIVTGESLYVKSMYYVIFAEKKYNGCYLRGNKDIPDWFNHLIINYNPDDEAQIEFGTLSATFIKSESSNPSAPLPAGCLTY